MNNAVADIDDFVRTDPPPAGGTLPAVLSPREPGSTLGHFTRWLTERRAFVERTLLAHGALLLRGFPVRSVADFGEVTRTASERLLDYSERSSPRSQVADK